MPTEIWNAEYAAVIMMPTRYWCGKELSAAGLVRICAMGNQLQLAMLVSSICSIAHCVVTALLHLQKKGFLNFFGGSANAKESERKRVDENELKSTVPSAKYPTSNQTSPADNPPTSGVCASPYFFNH